MNSNDSERMRLETDQARVERIQREAEDVKWTIVGQNVPTIWHDGTDPSIQGWFWDFNPELGPLGKVYAEKKDLEGPDGYAQAIAGHEYSHVMIDKPGLFTQDDITTKGKLIGYNWFADNAVENYLMGSHRRGRAWIRTKAEYDIRPGGKLDHKQEALIEQKLGYIPKHMLLGGMVRQYFYKKEVTGELNENQSIGPQSQIDQSKLTAFMEDESYPLEVRQVFKELFDDGAIEAMYHTIPSPFVKEEAVERVAQDRITIYRDRVWPKYKTLVENSYSDQALIDFIKKLIEGKDNGEGVKGQSSGQVIIINFDSLPEDVQQEIIDAFSSNQDESSQPGENKPQTESPLDKLSPSAKQAVQEAFDTITEEEEKQLTQKATDEIGGVEDELNRQMQPQTNKPGSTVESKIAQGRPGDSDQNQAGDDEQEDGDAQEGVEGSNQATTTQNNSRPPVSSKPNATGKPEKTTTPTPEDYSKLQQDIQLSVDALRREIEIGEGSYIEKLSQDEIQSFEKQFDEFWAANPLMADWADLLAERLWPILRPDKKPKKRYTSRPNRASLSVKKYFREQLEGGLQYWETTETFERTSVGITYLVDLSGSTYDDVDQAQTSYSVPAYRNPVEIHRTILGKELELVSSALKAQLELCVRSEVHGFPGKTRTTEIYVPAESVDEVLGDDDLSTEIKAGIWSMVEESGGNTPTEEAILQSYQRILLNDEQSPQLKRDINFLVVVTDGQPNSGPYNTKAAIEAIYQDATQRGIKIVILFLGIGPGTEFVNHIVPKLSDELREKIAEILSEERNEEVDPNSIGLSFQTANETTLVYPIILDEMMRNPNSFREETENIES